MALRGTKINFSPKQAVMITIFPRLGEVPFRTHNVYTNEKGGAWNYQIRLIRNEIRPRFDATIFSSSGR